MPPKWWTRGRPQPARRIDDEDVFDNNNDTDDEDEFFNIRNNILNNNNQPQQQRERLVAPQRRGVNHENVRYPVRQDIPRGDVRAGTGHLVNAKCWLFTLRLSTVPGRINYINIQNGELLPDSYIVPEVDDVFGLDFLVYQLEEGNNGTLGRMIHYQGYFEWDERVNARTIVERMNWTGWDMADIWLSPRRATQASAIAYCTKDATCVRASDGAPLHRVQQGTSHPPDATLSVAAQINNMIQADKSYQEIANAFPDHVFRMSAGIVRGIQEFRKAQPPPKRDKVEVFVLWGDTGLGKSTFVENMEGEDRVYRKDLQEIYFDGYDHRVHDVLLIDEFNGPTDKLKLTTFLTWLDHHRLWLPQKYGGCYAAWKKVYITSNSAPNDWFAKHPEPEHIRALYRRLLTGGIAKLIDSRREDAHERHQQQMDKAGANPHDHAFPYFMFNFQIVNPEPVQ